MGLKILKGADGKPRPNWYARIKRDGRDEIVNLKVPLVGQPPTDAFGRFDLKKSGSARFENSRAAAKKALEKVLALAEEMPSTAIQSAAFRIQNGRSLKSPRLADMARIWREAHEAGSCTERNLAECDSKFFAFVKFATRWARKNNRRVVRVNDIDADLAGAYIDSLKATAAWNTVKNYKHLLSGFCKRFQTNGQPNPFAAKITNNKRESAARVPRKTLDEREVQKLFDVTREDSLIHPLVVCAACTGLRLGDVCNLLWESVDLKAGRISVKSTSKTGASVELPILGAFRRVLEDAAARTFGSPFVFPRAAAEYKQNVDGICRAVKPYFAAAVAKDEPEVEEGVLLGTPEDSDPLELGKVLKQISEAGFAEKKAKRVAEVFSRFKAGEDYPTIAAALGLGRGAVSEDLKSVEKLTGVAVRPGLAKCARHKASLERDKMIEKTRERRKGARRAASIYGWHSLRGTFVVLALKAGVPEVDVQKAVGHSTFETTLKYYFNPKTEEAVRGIAEKMDNSVLGTGEGATPLLPAPAATENDVAARLLKLKTLAETGLITEEELARERARILAEI